jgi:hypothetical protein
MGKVNSSPTPVKLFIGMLSNDISLFEQISHKLKVIYGPSDLLSPVWKWDHSDYYKKEMGTGLKRQFIFFKELIDPGSIAEIKLKTIELEKQLLNEKGGRRINLDPGYLDAAKLVLVSTKDFSHRIYLGQGIYGEVTLYYSGKTYQTLPYTFPDFRTDDYQHIFKQARLNYKKNLENREMQG